MKCEQIRALMMDYLYDELSIEDREEFISHLDRCKECREEAGSLKATSGVLQQWGEVAHDIRVIAVKENDSFFGKFKGFLSNGLFRPRRMAIGFACAISAVFLLLAFANTEISITNGNFSMRMSFFERPEQKVNTDMAGSTQLVEELVRENFQLTRSLIEQSEARQQQELAYVLSSFKKDIDQQRYQDLNLIKYGFKDLQKNTYQQIREIDNTLSQIIRPANVSYHAN